MAARSSAEQLALELINRARLDPAGEAARFGIALNEGLAAGTISTTAKQPLAGSSLLVDAARGHSQHMLNVDRFDHLGIGDGDPGSRATAAGYTPFSRLGENIAVTSGNNQSATTPGIHELLFVDAGIAGRGHRLNILDANFREVGIGQLTGLFRFTQGGAELQSTMQTQDYGTLGTRFFITGVAYNDADADNFYDIGEARGNVTVTVTRNGAQTGTDTTEAAGGYDIGVVTVNNSIVRFSGGGLAAPVSVTVLGGQQNAKVDLVGANTIFSSATAILGSGATNLKLLGVAALNGTGNELDNRLEGNSGANVLTGGAGNDTYVIGAGDSIVEAAGSAGGTRDTVVSSTLTLNLASFANVENATLTGTAARNAIGTNGANVLSGAGNTAANVLTGLDGDDTYIIGVGDTIVEQGSITPSLSSDTIQTSALSISLANFANVENVTLTGSAVLSATGSQDRNVLNGATNSSANVLTGLDGDDTYIVGAGDTVVEVADTLAGFFLRGRDTVQSSEINLNLASFRNVERIVLTGELALTAVGNARENDLVGNTAANRMVGGGASDNFVFATALGTSFDTIVDFAAGVDDIQLDTDIFSGFGTSAIVTAAHLRSGGNLTTANTTSQRLIYNTTTGDLFYDADGSANGSSAIKIANLENRAAIGVGDFELIV